MMTLVLRINSLPKEIKILIDEYNVDHRPKMYCVLKIFKQYKPYRKTCENCNITKIGVVLYSYSKYVDEFICKKCKIYYLE
jgi:hypothetical protein